MKSIVNIAAYKFVELQDLETLQTSLAFLCGRLALKGTILLSHEGINLFLAGPRLDMDRFLDELRSMPAFADLAVKESLSETVPFRKMRVRIRREIVTFDQPGIDPAETTSARITPQELKRWLDEKRPITLLDVRNTFEFEFGSFEGAIPAGIESFREFPEAVSGLAETVKGQPVVMFCTGGIRCEKAGPYLEQHGFPHVYQLDGGILKYFEECGSAHFRGACFVFDDRIALTPELEPTA